MRLALMSQPSRSVGAMKESPSWEPLGILHAHVRARVGGWMTGEGNGDFLGLSKSISAQHAPISPVLPLSYGSALLGTQASLLLWVENKKLEVENKNAWKAWNKQQNNIHNYAKHPTLTHTLHTGSLDHWHTNLHTYTNTHADTHNHVRTR